MSQLNILLILHCVSWNTAFGLRSFVYQKDVSDYCRRRAVPSVFLGRLVMETNAQMLHFSKLDLPYSCFISIRTESSNNIIMVIQLSPRSELAESCEEFGNQLIVYEFGETFGGYWGPLPANVVNPVPQTGHTHKIYTLRNNLAIKAPDISEDNESTEETTKKTTTTWHPTENDEFITIDVPLVNLSASLVPDDSQVEKSFDIDDTFDMLYDVTPRKGENYETSIVPLMQFSLRTHKENDRRYNGEVRYDLDYSLGTFTPDYRLTLPVMTTRKILNRNRNLWKLKKLRKKPLKPNRMNAPLFTTESGIFSKVKNNIVSTHRQGHEIIEIKDESAKDTINQDSLSLIEDIMKSLNKTRTYNSYETKLPQSYVQVIKNISDMHHNFSAYLAPWPMYTYIPLNNVLFNYTSENRISPLSEPINVISKSTQADRKHYTKSTNEELHSTRIEKDKDNIEQLARSFAGIFDEQNNISSASPFEATSLPGGVSHNASTQSSNTTMNSDFYTTSDDHAETHATKPLLDRTIEDVVTFGATTTKRPLGSLVDHESWENVVQSAPVMAVLLNQHTPNKSHDLPSSNETHQRAGINRKRGKRHMKSIPIGQARPHARTSSFTTRARSIDTELPDIQDFAQLFELPDDELSNHVALRFMRQYAGNAKFNICDTADYRSRHVVLFNTSRIVLALGNFSVSRMTVVLTGGHKLVNSEAVCPQRGIECQVGGTRVCIDANSACDGVPNCGAHDIYDEDRLQCGVALGLAHNVVLAAVTFLAVLLTMLFIVHYWLKRCVPKVADAFFIYTDSAENVLFLDSIMRSPTDVDNANKFLYPATFFEENLNLYVEEKKLTFFQRLSMALSKLNIFKQRRRHKSCELTEAGDLQDLKPSGMRKIYSFTQLEIRKMIGTSKIDEEVQTTESLEMAFLKLINSYKNDISTEAIETAAPSRQRDVLHRLELFNSPESSFEVPGPSSRSNDPYHRPSKAEDEIELHSTEYEAQAQGITLSETLKTKETCASEGTMNSKKCLRFEEQATFIMAENDQSTEANQEPLAGRQSVVLGTGSNRLIKRNINSLETLSQDSERTGSDFRSFFMGKKTKKKKNNEK